MAAPEGFTWIDKPLLAAMAQPSAIEEYVWLREQGIQLVVSLSEDSPRRDWINEVGLFSSHLPIQDMHPPTQAQIDQFIGVLQKAHAKKIGVAVHCTAGMGRTGTMLACFFVKYGMSAWDAIIRIRRLRPGSVETEEQADAITEYARRQKMQQEFEGP